MLIITLGLLTTSAFAEDVTLGWDPVTDPDLDHYTLYQADRIGDKSGPWGRMKEIPGDQTTTITTIADGKNVVWYVTASDGAGNESGPSNTVERYDRTPPGIPPNLHKVENP